MTQHACPFCGAKLDVAAVPPGKPFRCGGCNVALDAGETRLTQQEVRGFRARQRVRRWAFSFLTGLAAGVGAYFTGRGEMSLPMILLATGCSALFAGGVMLAVLGYQRAPVPVAPVAGKVEA